MDDKEEIEQEIYDDAVRQKIVDETTRAQTKIARWRRQQHN